MKCALCEDCGWVCEDHPDAPWDGIHACICGAAGMPCPQCNPSDLGHPPRPPRISSSIRRGGGISWSREFDDPIPLPRGRQLVTLADARAYIFKLKKADQDSAEWQAAIGALLLVADLGGPSMFAWIGVLRALNRHVERVFNPERKERLGPRGSWKGTNGQKPPAIFCRISARPEHSKPAIRRALSRRKGARKAQQSRNHPTFRSGPLTNWKIVRDTFGPGTR